MSTNSTAANSFLDGYAFCSVPSQLYIGGFFRTAGATTAAATVTATVPAALTNTTGNTIPFSQIRWTTSGMATAAPNRSPRYLRQRRRADRGRHGEQLVE